MNYEEAMELIDYLNDRFRRASMKPWHRWAVDINWNKLKRWRQLLEESK